MKDLEKLGNRIPERYESWVGAIEIALLIFICWIEYGIIFTSIFFDEPFFQVFKVVNKNDVLSYLAVLLGIQIPIFMLFLQEMTQAGHVKRRILPRVTKFKEIILSLITATTFILLSPSAGYIYFPLAVMIAVNFLAVFRAITVTFQQDQYENRMFDQLRLTAKKSFDSMMDQRREHNKRLKEIESSKFIEVSYFDKEYKESKTIEILANISGTFDDVDVDDIISVLTREFKVENNRQRDKKSLNQELPILRLRSTPFYDVDAESVIAELVVPNSYKREEKLKRRIEKALRIAPKPTQITEIKYLDEIISDFTLAITEDIKQEDAQSLEIHLIYLKVLLDEIDLSIATDDRRNNETYKLSDAYNELSSFINDPYSKRQRRLYDLLTDSLLKATQDGKVEVAQIMIRFIYRKIIDANSNPLMMTIARFDGALLYTVGRFIYDESLNGELTKKQEQIRDNVYVRVKEMANMLLWELRKEELDKKMYEPRRTWFVNRLERYRGLLLAAIKNECTVEIDLFMSILEEIEREIQYGNLRDEDAKLVRSTIFMIAAYLRYKGSMNGAAGLRVKQMVNNWGAAELTDVYIDCRSKDYADNWRIDVFDNPADGVVRAVPDYDQVLAKLWADMMLSTTFTADVRFFGEKSKFEQTLIFTEGGSDVKNNKLLDYIKGIEAPEALELSKLVKAFIEVRRNYEDTILTDVDLDREKVSEFKRLTNNAYKESSVAARIFKDVTSFIHDKSRTTKDYKQFGINEIFDKEAFIHEWHNGYITAPMAEQLGRQIAQGEDRFIFEKMLGGHVSKFKIRDMPIIIRRMKGADKWVVISNKVHDFDLQDLFKKELKKSSSHGDMYFKGIKQSAPIQHVYIDEVARGVYFVKQADVGTVSSKQSLKNPVKVAISAYSKNRALLGGLLKARPQWLTEKGGPYDQTKFLNTKVNLLARRVFKYSGPSRLTKIYFMEFDKDSL